MRTTCTAALFVSALLAVPGCEEGHARTTLGLTVHTEADPGVPLGGVMVSAGESPIGTSDATGSLVASLSGDEGVMIPVSATCPRGHRDGQVRASVTLRPVFDVSGRERGLEVTLSCPPAERQAVLVVRAGGEGSRGGLPVWVDGEQVAVTDASGVAHVPIGMVPGECNVLRERTAAVSVPEDSYLRDSINSFDFRADQSSLDWSCSRSAASKTVCGERKSHSRTASRKSTDVRVGSTGNSVAKDSTRFLLES